jgi:hypothetical protein
MRGCNSLVQQFIKENVAIGEALAIKEMELEEQVLSHNNISKMEDVNIEVKSIDRDNSRIIFYKDVPGGIKMRFAAIALSNKQLQILKEELVK